MDGSGQELQSINYKYVDKTLYFNMFRGGKLRKFLNEIFDRGGFVAGGMARKLYTGNFSRQGDIDIYPRNESNLDSIRSWMKNYDERGNYNGVTGVTYNKWEYRLDNKNWGCNGEIQLVERFGPPEKILKDFDFTICKFYVDNFSCYAREDALIAERSKTIRVADDYDGEIKAYRLLKYILQGYSLIDKREAIRIATLSNDFSHFVMNIDSQKIKDKISSEVREVFELFATV